MKLTLKTVALLFTIFAIYFIYGCNKDSGTSSQVNTKDSVGIYNVNDTLIIGIDVENMTKTMTKNDQTRFSTDSVDVYTDVPELTAGKMSLFLIGGQILPDTTCKKIFTSPSSPSTVRTRNDRFNNSFSIVLSGFTGKATIRVTKKH